MAEVDQRASDPAMADMGDAAAMVAVIDAWLRQRPAEPDWDGCLGQMRDALTQLASFPMIAEDAEAQAILAQMAHASDMDELAAKVDGLAERVASLLAARHPRRGRRALFEAVAPASPSPADEVIDNGRIDRDVDYRAGRMMFRL